MKNTATDVANKCPELPKHGEIPEMLKLGGTHFFTIGILKIPLYLLQTISSFYWIIDTENKYFEIRFCSLDPS